MVGLGRKNVGKMAEKYLGDSGSCEPLCDGQSSGTLPGANGSTVKITSSGDVTVVYPDGVAGGDVGEVRLSVPLLQVSPDLKFMVVETAATTAADLELGWTESGLTVRRVRGSKMRTYQGLFDEFAAALQFPPYFGENSNAFDECLTDLSWLPPQSGYVLVIAEPGEVLVDVGDGDDLDWLVRSLTRAQAEWAAPVETGEWWDRPTVPFHVVLQWVADESAITRDRWVAAGAELVPFPL